MKLRGVKMAIPGFVAALASMSLTAAPPSMADPTPPESCNYPACTPGIAPHVVLGANCSNTTYYVFGVTDWGGRLVFCGSPASVRAAVVPVTRDARRQGGERRLCRLRRRGGTAPDGLFLTCVPKDGAALWLRGDL